MGKNKILEMLSLGTAVLFTSMPRKEGEGEKVKYATEKKNTETQICSRDATMSSTIIRGQGALSARASHLKEAISSLLSV